MTASCSKTNLPRCMWERRLHC